MRTQSRCACVCVCVCVLRITIVVVSTAAPIAAVCVCVLSKGENKLAHQMIVTTIIRVGNNFPSVYIRAFSSSSSSLMNTTQACCPQQLIWLIHNQLTEPIEFIQFHAALLFFFFLSEIDWLYSVIHPFSLFTPVVPCWFLASSVCLKVRTDLSFNPRLSVVCVFASDGRILTSKITFWLRKSSPCYLSSLFACLPASLFARSYNLLFFSLPPLFMSSCFAIQARTQFLLSPISAHVLVWTHTHTVCSSVPEDLLDATVLKTVEKVFLRVSVISLALFHQFQLSTPSFHLTRDCFFHPFPGSLFSRLRNLLSPAVLPFFVFPSLQWTWFDELILSVCACVWLLSTRTDETNSSCDRLFELIFSIFSITEIGTMSAIRNGFRYIPISQKTTSKVCKSATNEQKSSSNISCFALFHN